MYYCASQLGGTICYLAPEVLRGDDRHISTSADMWSLGAVLAYVANDRKHLFRTERDVFNWRGDRSPMERKFKYMHYSISATIWFTGRTGINVSQLFGLFAHYSIVIYTLQV